MLNGVGGVLAKRKKSKIDVLSHFLVPPMKVLSEKEKTSLLKKYNVSENMLPKMKKSDPAAIALNANVGDVVRIERDDGTGKFYSYRVIVE